MEFDTRTKIVEPASLPALCASMRIAKGWFDVLTAETCALLQSAKPADGTLVVLVYKDSDSRPAPLQGCDRAQMIAALESVDWVCLCHASEADAITSVFSADSVIDVDAVQARDVIRDVLELHSRL